MNSGWMGVTEHTVKFLTHFWVDAFGFKIVLMHFKAELISNILLFCFTNS